MADDAVDLSSLLCSRLCHDLLGPVGALGNGLELLAQESDPALQRQTLALVNQSAVAITTKLSFFRLAFGGRDGMENHLDKALLDRAIRDLFATRSKIKVVWATRPIGLPIPVARLLLLLAMLAGDTLVRGGELTLAATLQSGRTEIVARAVGDRLAFSTDVRELLLRKAAHPVMDARSAPAALAVRLARLSAMQLQISPPDPAVLLLGASRSV